MEVIYNQQNMWLVWKVG